MLNLNDLIGVPLEKAKEKLQSENIGYDIVNQETILNKFDTLLVVQVKKDGEKVVLLTDKFLLNI